MRSSLFFSLLIALLFFGCREDFEEFQTTIEVPTPPAIMVNARVTGKVVHSMGRVVNDVTVNMPGVGSSITDAFGQFSFPASELDANGQLLYDLEEGE